jgi:hypothetical protein
MTLYDMMTSLQHDILTFVAGQVVTLYDMMTSLQHGIPTFVARSSYFINSKTDFRKQMC